MTLREEIQNIIDNLLLIDPEQIYPDEIADRILELIEKRIDKKIEILEEEVKSEEFIALNDCMGCIQEKKKAYLEMKDMLKK